MLFQQIPHLLGTANLWASLTPVVFTYLFYNMFDSSNPEGLVTDTTVITIILFCFFKFLRIILISLVYS